METTATKPKLDNILTRPPKWSFSQQIAQNVNGGLCGGFFELQADGQGICQYRHWAFHSCAVATLEGFKLFGYGQAWGKKEGRFGPEHITNFEVLEEHHDHLFKWLKNNTPGPYNAQEFIMALSNSQWATVPKMMKHPWVKEVDQFSNKAHGYAPIHIVRVSLQQDFAFHAK